MVKLYNLKQQSEHTQNKDTWVHTHPHAHMYKTQTPKIHTHIHTYFYQHSQNRQENIHKIDCLTIDFNFQQHFSKIT